MRAQLEGLDEPIATWLRESNMTEQGIIEANYLSALEQIAKRMNCSMASLKTFVLSDDLVMGKPFPRTISTLCSDDETRAADFFIAASFADPKNPVDVDPRNLEMFAWDDTAKRYVFYAALPVAGSTTKVQIEVEPRRCAGCHLNSTSLDDDNMPMLPIMNELTAPWPHWNAEPALARRVGRHCEKRAQAAVTLADAFERGFAERRGRSIAALDGRADGFDGERAGGRHQPITRGTRNKPAGSSPSGAATTAVCRSRLGVSTSSRSTGAPVRTCEVGGTPEVSIACTCVA